MGGGRVVLSSSWDGTVRVWDPSDGSERRVLTVGDFVVGLAVKARGRAVRTGSEAMIGSPAEVVSWSGTEGRVRAHGEIWAARSEEKLAPGNKVRIASRDGLTLIVEGAKRAF